MVNPDTLHMQNDKVEDELNLTYQGLAHLLC